MKKTVSALIVVLPLLFLLVVFSAGNAASLSTVIPANGISIRNKPDNGVLTIDLATYQNDFRIEAEVTPVNAANKGYTFRVEREEGSEFADVTVSDDGTVSARSTGVARVVVESNDGGYTDRMNVAVGSSKPTDVAFILSQYAGDGSNLLVATDEGYAATLPTGRYAYQARVLPSALALADVEVVSGSGVLEEEMGTLLLPFSGETVLRITVNGGLNGDIVKTVRLTATRQATDSGFTVNGTSGVTIVLHKGTAQAQFYVEADGAPTVAPEYDYQRSYIQGYTAETVGVGQYLVTVTFAADMPDWVEELVLKVNVGEKTEIVNVLFAEFGFSLRADLAVADGERATVMKDRAVYIYAVPEVVAEGITYRWSVRGNSADVLLEPNDTGSRCTLTALQYGVYTLEVVAYKDGVSLGLPPVELTLDVIREITSVGFDTVKNNTQVGLGNLVVAGYRYEGGSRVANEYELFLLAYNVTEKLEGALNDIEITSSDKTIATVTIESNGSRAYLTPTGTGEVTITASWQGNLAFGSNVSASLTLYVAGDAVEVYTSDDVFRAADYYPIVLGGDIMLGADDNGDVLPLETRRAMLKTMRSTYNTEYYTINGRQSEAIVNYVLEFKHDVYGNGFALNANYFTNYDKDGATGIGALFKGPIYFVSYDNLASVAGQDNISFLVRTDGVTLYNVQLLGCSDESITEEGQTDLTKLNYVGTVLEVNASVKILNSRIRNGRNVVRVYGGNTDGKHYFIDSLAENTGCDDERITVTIEGSTISYGREFLLKTGANRALRATEASGGQEPALRDQSGNAYSTQTNRYLNDDYFYSQYVMTDLTVKDSVLETGGLFLIGVESNFSGIMLYRDAPDDAVLTSAVEWRGTGGTSFATVLRLEGDVRLYDWKSLDLVDSSTLIQSISAGQFRFTLDIKEMLNFVCGAYPEQYADLLLQQGGTQYVHGGIAFYGGGKNYSQLSISGLNEELKDFKETLINIDILKDSSDETLSVQGQMLPSAAGTGDFRFYLYDTNSDNSYAKQIADGQNGLKYKGIYPIKPF